MDYNGRVDYWRLDCYMMIVVTVLLNCLESRSLGREGNGLYSSMMILDLAASNADAEQESLRVLRSYGSICDVGGIYC